MDKRVVNKKGILFKGEISIGENLFLSEMIYDNLLPIVHIFIAKMITD